MRASPRQQNFLSSANSRLRFCVCSGVAWNKGIAIGQGQCPVMSYNRDLMKTILHDRVDLSKLLNVKIISLEEAPEAYSTFNKQEAVKYVIDPHGMLGGARRNNAGASSTK